MHDFVVVGIPLLAILTGILFNRNDVRGLRDEMFGQRGELQGELKGLRGELQGELKGLRGDLRGEFRELRDEMLGQQGELRGELRGLRGEVGELRSEMRAGFARIDTDLRQFYHVTGKLEGRIDEIAKR